MSDSIFPEHVNMEPDEDGYYKVTKLSDGLTKLELFSAMVLMGLLTRPDYSYGDKAGPLTTEQYAISVAKALIEELKKNEV